MTSVAQVSSENRRSEPGVPAASASLRYDFHAGIEGLDSIRAQWVGLAERLGPRKGLPHVALWYRCQIRYLRGSESMGFSTAWEGDRLVAVLPLMPGLSRARGWGRLGFSALELPYDPYNFFRDATIDPAAAGRISLTRLDRAARGRLGGGNLLRLSQLREDATVLELPEARRLAKLSVSSPNCFYVPLRAGLRPDELLSKQSRANLNNRRNRLRREGPIEFKHAPDDLPMDEAIRLFTELEASGWKGESGTGTATRCFPGRLALLGELAAGGDGLEVKVHLMFAGGAPIAAMFCITVGAAHLLLLSGYDERHAKVSPGHLLTHEVIRWAVARQLRELDFMSSAPHLRRWHPAERSMRQVTASDGSVKGRLVHTAEWLRGRWGKR